MRQRLHLFLAVGMLLWLPMSLLEDLLREAGILNTKDLSPWVGTETGSAMDYALNVWHWDALILLLGVFGAGCVLALSALTFSPGLRRLNGRA